MKNILFFILIIICLPFLGFCNISLPSIFSDHMVLQNNAQVKIWGWGKAGEEVRIVCSWDTSLVYHHKIEPIGRWQIDITTPGPGGPHKMSIEGFNKIEICDILLGEVWLCSGQSNMEWNASMGIDNSDEHIALAANEKIRFFSVNHKSSDYPQDDLYGEWVVCTPESMRQFSAVGYFFAKNINREIISPVGMINSSWGGTPAEIWMSEMKLNEDPILLEASKILEQKPWGPKDPGVVFNAMIYPLTKFKIAGALWYQGESNTDNATTYSLLLSTMIQDWRNHWDYEFPFYFVQIAPFTYGEDNMNGAVIRDQQRRVLDMVPNTSMVVTADIGDVNDIHPGNKEDVGKRLAMIALNKVYHKINTIISGPLYRTHYVKGSEVIVEFENAGTGLINKGKLDQFELAGEDGKFYPAKAIISGSTIVLNSSAVEEPKDVRYAMENTSSHTLFNKDELPASCFATDLIAKINKNY